MVKVAILVLAIAAAASAQQQITITDAGSPYTYTTDQISLDHGPVTEACTLGVWVVFNAPNYTGMYIQILPEIEEFCHDPLHRIGSARFVGLTTEYNAPSVTLFDSAYMSGNSYAFGEEGLSSISFPVLSFATINSQVQFFSEPDFGGETICLDTVGTNNGVGWTWVFLPGEYPWDITRAQSASLGCAAGAKVFRPTSVSATTTIAL